MMRCQIYRSETRAYTYLYLAIDKKLEDLPKELLKTFGEAEPVMLLNLAERENLAHADIATVKTQLASQGYYLQLPPELSVEDQLQRSFK